MSAVDRVPQMPWQSLQVNQMPQKDTLLGLQGSSPLTLKGVVQTEEHIFNQTRPEVRGS